MDVRFTKVLNGFFPKGKFWENQENVNTLIEGVSDEFARVYEKAKLFYNNFNILNSNELAVEHSQDYLIIQDKYTKPELQRIIVKYLNQKIEFLDAILDFANFTSTTITIEKPTPGFKFGSSQFGDKFGTRGIEENMQILFQFGVNTTCLQYAKIVWLVNFLKPPYIDVIFSTIPIVSDNRFTFGKSQFGDKFGTTVPCELF